MRTTGNQVPKDSNRSAEPTQRVARRVDRLEQLVSALAKVFEAHQTVKQHDAPNDSEGKKQPMTTKPTVATDQANLRIIVDGKSVIVSATEFALMLFLLTKYNPPTTPPGKQGDVIGPLAEFLRDQMRSLPVEQTGRQEIEKWSYELDQMLAKKERDDSSLRRRLSSLRSKFRRKGFSRSLDCLLPRARRFAISVHYVGPPSSE